jgi:hypothetical protein
MTSVGNGSSQEEVCVMAIQQRMRIPFKDVFPPAFPGVPSCSFLVPSGVCWGPGVGRRPPKCGVYTGQRPVALVGVTGFEPAASSSRTGDHSSLTCH